MIKNELIDLLKKYHIAFDKWGTGKAKSLEHLLKEIELGESVLVEEKNQLFREVRYVTFNVFYKKNGKKYKLFEDQQVYKDGRVINRKLDDSLLEKLKPNEDPINGAKRALQEELGITSEIEIEDKGVITETVEALSYPTLINHGTSYNFEVSLPDSEYKPGGYKEEQVDKTNYFKWKLI